MNKLIAFFQSKVVKIVAWLLLVVSAVALIVGGTTVESISSGVALTAGIITAVAALVAFISGQLTES